MDKIYFVRTAPGRNAIEYNGIRTIIRSGSYLSDMDVAEVISRMMGCDLVITDEATAEDKVFEKTENPFPVEQKKAYNHVKSMIKVYEELTFEAIAEQHFNYVDGYLAGLYSFNVINTIEYYDLRERNMQALRHFKTR